MRQQDAGGTVPPPSWRQAEQRRQDAGGRASGNYGPSELEGLKREIATTDEEIDNLVYELYGITDEERKIIEGSV